MLQMEGRHAEAIRAFRGSIAADTSQSAPYLAIARSYTELSRPDSALIWAEAALRRDGGNAELHRLAGLNLARLGRAEQAMAALRRALQLDPDDAGSRMNLLGLCDALRLPEEALRLIDEAPEDLRETSPMRARRARVLLQLNRSGDAILELVGLLRTERSFPEAEALLLLAMANSASPEEATARVESLLVARPELHRVRIGLVRILLAGDGWPAAEPHLAQLMRERPDDPAVLKMRGMFLVRAGKLEQAEDAFREAETTAPDDPEPLRWLCRISTLRERPGEALVIADQIQARAPGDREGALCRAFALSELRRTTEALAVLKGILQTDPADREASLLTAARLVDEKRFGEATGVLREVRRVHPDDREVAMRLGSTLERAGEIDSALVVFDWLLADDPDDALSLNYVGYMCIERGIRLEEAMARVRRAMEIDPENGAYVDSYGWGLFRLGRLQEAEEQLRRAVSLAPREPEIHRHLAQVLESRNRWKEARAAYRTALELKPDDPETRRLLDLLERRRAGQSEE